MRDRKSVERSGVADPISERWGRQHLTYVEVCLGHICVAAVVCGRDVLKYVLSGHCGSTSLPANRKMLSGASIVSISALPLFVTSTGSVTVTSTGCCASMVGALRQAQRPVEPQAQRPVEPQRSRRNSYTGFALFPCSGLSESVARGNRYIVP